MRRDLQLSLFPVLSPPHAADPTLAPPAAGPRGAPARPAGPGTVELPVAVTIELPGRIPREGVEVVLNVLGTEVPCRIRRSPRARRLRLLVERSASLTVVLPERCPVREVTGALEENARWILGLLERYRRASAARTGTLEGRAIRLLGEPHVVRVLRPEGLQERPRVWRSDGEIRISVPPLHPQSPSGILRRWLRDTAASAIPPRARSLSETLGFSPVRVGIRDQRTKWGSCSQRGALSFNWRLVLAPPEVLDYVIVHELCHLRELNHSSRFWELVRSLRPDFERERVWLRENGDALEV